MVTDSKVSLNENKDEEGVTSETGSSTTSKLPRPNFERGELVGFKWEILDELGAGGCGVVYRVMRVNDHCMDESDEINSLHVCGENPFGWTAALKVEATRPDKRHETLRMEALVLRRMQWSKYVCRMFLAGRLSPTMNAIVMTETGPSLSRLRRRCPDQKFTLSTAIRISILCINAIEDLHSIGFIHRDIKPSNFAIGLLKSERHAIRLLDFGLARAYLKWCPNENKVVHRQARPRAPFIGTERYCSMFLHSRIEQGRRDDLWSMFFSMMEMIKSKLPWRCEERRYMEHAKRKGVPFLLVSCPPEFHEFVAHIRSLDYDSAPNYKFLRGCLERVCRKRSFNLNDPFDWEEGGYFYKRYFKDT